MGGEGWEEDKSGRREKRQRETEQKKEERGKEK